jgi:hypothetical protein
MPTIDRQQAILDLLKNLDGLEPLKQLFWSQLNYERVNTALSRRTWAETTREALAADPVLFATGGDDNEFHVIYAQLNSDRLLLGLERPVVARLLQDHPYALFVFSNNTQDCWHFLNVKYDEKVDKRRLFRRITVGPNERLHNRLRTSAERIDLLNIESFAQAAPLDIQTRHDEAFDVEKVTKQFFDVFADLYHRVSEDIASVRGLEADSGKLAQQLLDRLLFLYFIQRKGWLNKQPDYLYNRFQQYARKPNEAGYYAEVLYPLFLCLSDADTRVDAVGHVPFLNGGLFEEGAKLPQAKQLAQARLAVKNKTFAAIFDNLLEKYNFTITEDTPLDVEVAIDPEMPGKIFESLILELEKDPDKDMRKLTGSYYTPRPIVHFMCQEALQEYLVTELAGGDTHKADAARERVRALLDLPSADQLDDAQSKWMTQAFTVPEAKLLRQAVLDCRVCDPAVGSGAFPLGMLQEMVGIVARLDVRLNGRQILQTRNYDYDLKKQIIESCLYGVDIQEQAVRLCEWRLWLSLVVDYQIDPAKPFDKAIHDVPSLPNLSFHIVRGDSLLERLFGHVIQLDKMAQDAKAKQLIESMQADKQAYFREDRTAEKRRLELKILTKQAELAERLIVAKQQAVIGYQPDLLGPEFTSAKAQKQQAAFNEQADELTDLKKKVMAAKTQLEALSRQKGGVSAGDLEALRRQYFQTGDAPTFMWRVDFAEVFVTKGGFDIVIENPPYVSFGLRGNKAAKQEWAEKVRGLYPGSAEYKISQYALFIDLCSQIAATRGLICNITPDSFLLGLYFSKVRRTLLDRTAIHKVVMFEEDFWKSGVVGRPTISVLQKNATRQFLSAVLCKTEQHLVRGDVLTYAYSQRYFESIPHNRFRLFFSKTSMEFVQAIEMDSEPLNRYARITTGVRSKSGQENVVATENRGANWKKGIVSGSQVLPYQIRWEGHYLHIDGRLLWAGGWDKKIVENPKIMIRQTGDSIICAIDTRGLYHLNNVHSLSPHDDTISLPFLAALLNSRLMNRYYHLVSLELHRPMAQTDIETLELLPVRLPTVPVLRKLDELIERAEQTSVRPQIDKIIASVYSLPAHLSEYLAQDDLYPLDPK